MFDNIFDIKNDRRLGIYLYRAGFGFWLCYIFLGASFMQPYVVYRLHCAVFCGFLMVSGLTASMTYDYYHHPAEFEQRKKWPIIAYVAVAAAVYFLVLREPPLF